MGLGMIGYAIDEGEDSQRNYQTSSIKEEKRLCEIHSEYISLDIRMPISLALKAYHRKRMHRFKQKLIRLKEECQLRC